MEEDAVCRLLRAGVVDVQVRPDTPGASWKPVEDWRPFQAALAPFAAGRAWDTAGKTGGGAAAQKEARDEAAAAEARRVELVRRDRDQRLTEEAERLLAPHKERVATFVEIAFTKGALVDEYGDPDTQAFPKEATRFLRKVAMLDKRWNFINGVTKEQVQRLTRSSRPSLAGDSPVPNHVREQQVVLWEVVSRLGAAVDAYAAVRKGAQRQFSGQGSSAGTGYELHILALLTPLPGVSSPRRIGQSGDCGGDLLCTVGSRRVVAQVKYYSDKVGTASVQEVYAAKANYSGDVAVVITNNIFTLPARRLAKQLGVELIERADVAALRAFVEKLRASS